MPTAHRLCAALLLAAVLRPASSLAQRPNLSATERSIVKAVDAHNASSLA
jgi:hypothetical protein